jgi:hypothetical protein
VWLKAFDIPKMKALRQIFSKQFTNVFEQPKKEI